MDDGGTLLDEANFLLLVKAMTWGVSYDFWPWQHKKKIYIYGLGEGSLFWIFFGEPSQYI